MKQIRATRKPRTEEISVDPRGAVGFFRIGIIGIGIIGAIEGIVFYALLQALNAAEVISVSPRPWFMVSAGIAWRTLRSIDISMKAG